MTKEKLPCVTGVLGPLEDLRELSEEPVPVLEEPVVVDLVEVVPLLSCLSL